MVLRRPRYQYSEISTNLLALVASDRMTLSISVYQVYFCHRLLLEAASLLTSLVDLVYSEVFAIVVPSNDDQMQILQAKIASWKLPSILTLRIEIHPLPRRKLLRRVSSGHIWFSVSCALVFRNTVGEPHRVCSFRLLLQPSFH